MSAPDLYVTDLSPEEAAAGFVVIPVGASDQPTAAVYAWGDPSHRLVKTRGRDGIVFQLQAFGLHPRAAGAADWHAERHWPGQYGPGWVLERLREHLGRRGYRPLVELQVPADDAAPLAVAV
jgi:hypothetical protein